MSSTVGRIAIVLLPLLVIAVFWAMSAMERRVAGHPGERGFLQRNGAAISLYLILAVGIWTLLGLGIGTMIRNQIAAILVAVAVTFLVEPLLTVALAAAGTDVAGVPGLDHLLAVTSDDPRVVREGHVTTYHVLWELVHVFLEARVV